MKIVKFLQPIIPVLAVIAAAVYNLEALMFVMNVLYIVMYAIFFNDARCAIGNNDRYLCS